MVVISVTVLSIPIAGVLGIVGNVKAASVAELRVGFLQEVDSLNPYLGLNDASYIFYGLVYDGLTVLDNDMNPTPDLALGVWAVPITDPDMVESGEPYGSVWQYNLTNSAFWTDGEPFTADDVLWNMQINADYYDDLWAFQPYAYFMRYAEKIDDSTVRVHFYNRATGQPMPAAYAYLISLPMLPKHKFEEFSIAANEIGFAWTGLFEDEDVPIVGTGPFMATSNIKKEKQAGDKITLVKNENYHWKTDKGKEIQFDRLVMNFYKETTAMVLALRNGELDIASLPPASYLEVKSQVDSEALKNVTCFTGPKITQYWTEIGINMNEGATDANPARLDPAVRTAMAMATDKQYICDQFYYGLADPGTTVIPPVNTKWHYEPTADELISYNLEAAGDMLTAAGYVDIDEDDIRECTASSLPVQEGWTTEGKKLIFNMLLRREYPEEKDIAQYLKTEWAKIGIVINYEILDEAELSTQVYYYNYDTMIWYWSADIDPNYQLYVLTKAAWNGWNDNMYSSPAYEENYTKTVSTMDPVERKTYVDNCQRVHYRDVAYIIMAYAWQCYAYRTDTFSGWGDWAADPGRTMDNFWMGNPLFFDLVYLGETDGGPPWLAIIVAIVVVAAVVVAVMLLRKRGRKKEEEISESPLGE
ncbi:MAG: ABC transporter substrate-binding protein [Candidatus Thermoplasmatota archaeon]|nr:ABC transporter substrate-binding protein [Candidatus Thermoplasmatota archaeon]